MARTKKTVEMIVGQKVSDSDVQAQPNKAGEGQQVPMEGGEVGGRGGEYEYVICPTCSAINYVYVDDDMYLWYRCWYTGRGRHYFRV
jgi:hypothetical protein